MKKSLIALAVSAAVAAPMVANAAPDTKFFGYSQITAALGEGTTSGVTPNDGLRFGADRIRLGYKVKNGNAFGKLQVDFMKADSSGSPSTATLIGVPEIIKDAVVGYKVNNMASVSAGVFKTPVGMDFNTSGKNLDITKRGMEKAFVLERAAGLMVSGRKINGFGYDVGIFNPAGRSGVVTGPGVVGNANAYAGRGMFDMNGLHLEASAGWSEKANGTGGSSYKVWDVAGSYKTGPITGKFEYINGEDLKGVANDNESAWYIHGGYKINHMVEAVARYYAASYDPAAGSSTDLSNLYIGANVFFDKNNARVQLNYVVAGGDKTDYTGMSKGYQGDVFLAQFQVGF